MSRASESAGRWIVLVAALATAPALASSKPAPELAWIPKDADLLMGFEPAQPAQAEMLGRFRDEVLFAAGVSQPFQDFALVTGVDSGREIRRLVIAAAARGPRTEALGIALWRFPKGLPGRLALKVQGARQRYRGAEVYVIPRTESASEWGLAFVDGEHVVFGDVPLVKTCLDLRQAGSGESVSQDAKLMARVREAAEGAQAWAVFKPTWLGFDADVPPSAADIKGRSLTRSLGAIRSVDLSARAASGVGLVMRTEAGDDEDAFLLADALRDTLGGLRRGGNPQSPLYAPVEEARVERKGPTVSLEMQLTPEALQRLRNDDTSRRLLRWRLGAEEREAWQRIGDIVAFLGLAEGSRVADVGAGGGFFTVRLARAVGAGGRVVAEDISEKGVAELQRRIRAAPFDNVDVVLGSADDPKLPEDSLDAVLIVNAYHEMPQHQAMLEHIRRALGPGGRLVLVEPYSPTRRGEPREAQEGAHIIAPELVEEDLRQAGFEVVERSEAFIVRNEGKTQDWLILAQRPR